ncbi:MAG: hypothetical protein GTO41_18415, partial [Burkholderiales bacterium]|nr:hypothetical protein [Burkholderiales bacterium]
MRLIGSPRYMTGVSLVELMIGIALGLAIISGAIGVFSSAVSSQSSALKSMRLEQELRSVMDLI